METWSQIMISEVERLTGRALSESQRKTVEWLAGFEDESRANIMQLIRSAYQNGISK